MTTNSGANRALDALHGGEQASSCIDDSFGASYGCTSEQRHACALSAGAKASDHRPTGVQESMARATDPLRFLKLYRKVRGILQPCTSTM